jgi:opacity protein-like surface antigen
MSLGTMCVESCVKKLLPLATDYEKLYLDQNLLRDYSKMMKKVLLSTTILMAPFFAQADDMMSAEVVEVQPGVVVEETITVTPVEMTATPCSQKPWYVGLRAGTATMNTKISPKVHLTSDFAPQDYEAQSKMVNTGFAGEAVLGYGQNLGSFHWSAEVGFGADTAKRQGTPTLLNEEDAGPDQELSFKMRRQMTWAFGIGIGTYLMDQFTAKVTLRGLVSRFRMDYQNLNYPAEISRQAKWVFGVAPGLQLSYGLSEKMDMTLGYEYQIYQRFNPKTLYDNAEAESHLSPVTGTATPRYHSVMLGLNYKF